MKSVSPHAGIRTGIVKMVLPFLDFKRSSTYAKFLHICKVNVLRIYNFDEVKLVLTNARFFCEGGVGCVVLVYG